MGEPPPQFVPLDIPPGVPLARPVQLTAEKGPAPGVPQAHALPYAHLPGLDATNVPPSALLWNPPLTRLRALLELLALIPAGLLGSLAAALIFHTVLKSVADQDVRWYYLGGTGIMAVFVMAACVLMLRIDGLPLASIGWTARDFWANAGIGLAGFVSTYILMSALALLVLMLWPDLLPQTSQAQEAIQENIPPMRRGPMMLSLVFVSIWEEFVFRGFLLTRLKALLRRWWLAIPVGAVIFGCVHLYEGPFAVGLVAILGLVLGLLLLWRKSLVPCIVFHLAHNLVMLELLRTISANWN